MVSQKEWAVKKCHAKKRRSCSRPRYGILLDLPVEMLYLLRKRSRHSRREICCHILRRRHVFEIRFNFNSFSTEECLKQFRFKPKDMNRILSIFAFDGRTGRRGYVCSDITAACIILRRLSYPCRWYDVELMFGMCTSKMSEIFCELSESIYDKHKNLLTPFRGRLMSQRASIYAERISSAGAMLPHCIGFIDVTKIQTCRPSGRHVLHQSLYSGHKRVHCLLFCTITTADGLMCF